jgi:hypothetical protein
MITIPYNKLSVVHHYCNKKISPRQYYFHNAFGSDEWQFSQTSEGWILKTDPKHETYIALKFL